MVKIGVISDTHGLLREEVKEALKGCELILHTGDVDEEWVLTELQKIAPVSVVQGNMDRYWAPRMPEKLRVEYAGLRFFLMHDKSQIRESLKDEDIVICGHTHRYDETYEGSQLWLNPGSCGPQRFHRPVTMAVLEVDETNRRYVVKKIEIDPDGGWKKNVRNADPRPSKAPMDRRKLVKAVMKDMNRGRSISEIAARYGISEKLADRLCRLYVTHPGIDAEGIINKMGNELW